MIKIQKKENVILHNRFVSIEVIGHANYAPLGKDIVCASVSALYQTLLLSIEHLAIKSVSQKGDNEKQIVLIRNPSSDIELLIDSFFIGVSAISYSYPDYVSVN